MDDVQKVKSKIDIVELINGYVPLKKGGRNFKSPCPFHNEKSPSFTVSPERQIWHCFGCQKGGDIFTFVQEYEKLDFSEALKLLASKAGVKLTTSPFRTEIERQKDIILTLNSLSAQFYNYILTTHPAGKAAREYLTKRKINEKLINTFQIGFAPSNNALSDYLTRKKGFKEEELILAGLSTRRRGLSDFFFDRIIFPIHDSRGNIIAFSARTLKDDVLPKYVNTKETPVYRKGETLYGIFITKDEIKKEGKAIIMEGEFDVISSFREGIGNTVAVKGTALTLEQIKLLKRFTQKIVFCFDSDRAGVEAQRRSIALIEAEGIQAGVIVPPDGKDPDELLFSNPVAFQIAVKEEVNIYDYIIQTSTKQKSPFEAQEIQKILSKTLPYFSAIENEVVKEHYLKKLASFVDSSYESVSREADKLNNTKPNIVPVLPQQENISYIDRAIRELLSLILQNENSNLHLSYIKTYFNDVPLPQTSYGKLLNISLSETFETVMDLSKKIPEELSDAFNMCLLLPVSAPDEKNVEQIIIQLALQTRVTLLKQAIQVSTKKIAELNEKNRDEELNLENEEFKRLSILLKNAQKEMQKSP